MKNNSITIGKACEALVISKLLKIGINPYLPFSEDTKIDLIYIENQAINRCQIKAITKYGMQVRKIKVNSKTNTKIYSYTKEDVDLFIGVDLENEKIYFLPIEWINKFTSTISLKRIKKEFVGL